ncbi:MAG: zinc finger Ran-binding domain-containing family 2 protein [Clostridia bacterium]|nr:zinc finger Ran-binding domain-containing family 2 protein [Clostridia bacterium]
MSILLVILLVMQVVVGSLSFIVLLGQSILIALLYLFLTVLQIALTAAVLSHHGQLEEHRYELERLRYAVRELQKGAETEMPSEYPAESPAELARNTWECVKCGTVNKAQTTRCTHCGAAYSASINPTDDPAIKREISRWIKDDKKQRRLFKSK